jgi:glutamate racemase
MIGFYDSGVGGLTIVEKFLRWRPNTKCLYLADTQNCPLGNKTDEEILEITRQGVEFLFQKGCKLVVLACNTATSLAVRPLQQKWLPSKPEYLGHNVLGVVRPVTEELINQKISVEPILLLATRATCRSQFYQNELKVEGFTNYDCLSFEDLALAIEQQKEVWVDKILHQELDSSKIAPYQTFVLACTHYPIIKGKISAVLTQNLDRSFRLIDQSELVSDRLVAYLNNHPEYVLEKGGLEVFVSGNQAEDYRKKLERLFPVLELTSIHDF